jgi:hypothetical protein
MVTANVQTVENHIKFMTVDSLQEFAGRVNKEITCHGTALGKGINLVPSVDEPITQQSDAETIDRRSARSAVSEVTQH